MNYDQLSEDELLTGVKETAAAINNLGTYRNSLTRANALPRSEEARSRLMDSLGQLEESLEKDLRELLAALARKK